MGVGGSAADPVCPPSGGYTACFEGPEKLLEVIFSSPNGDDSLPVQIESSCDENSSPNYARKGLRTVSRSTWEDMLRLVRAEIISEISNEFLDAYLLSESSLFVYPTKLVIKTCGTTTLLNALPRILEIAEEECGLSIVEKAFYSRKNFLFPEKQLYPHNAFQDEVNFLDAIFENGSAYTIGKVNGDHWHLYVTENKSLPGSTFHAEADQCIEILMTELDPQLARQNFFRESYDNPCTAKLAKRSGISKLMPGSLVDDFLFDPCGYSLNGLIGPAFWTIHVTPEAHCSYASFETNASLTNAMTQLVPQVLNVFRPRKFTLVQFFNHQAKPQQLPKKPEVFGYKRSQDVIHHFDSYDLVYHHFVLAE